MNITTNLTKNDYLQLIRETKTNPVESVSHKPVKLNINNNEYIGEMQCLGVKLCAGERTIEGKYVPPIMKFVFKILFQTENIDAVSQLSEHISNTVDNKKYYLGDWILKDKVFDLKLISYDLFEERDYEYNK